MPDLPPTTARKPTDPDEPDRTGRYDGPPTPVHPPAGFTAIEPGTVIAGRYKLVKELGEGGMGAVWMAEQSEPVRRLVALKLIRTGMDSRDFLFRFEAERQALSMMDHPNIARVFDAGTLPDSRPFFVMELVKGTPITKFCDEKRLTPRQRLELFVPVCNAIQHAHQKGIIHRDIKPNNVLVAVHDDKPVPKVIDFGVAKATGQPLSDKTMHTLGLVGTPEYMSPEQATENQLDIDTRSDVYSLGVLLYELLTGTTPVKASGLKQKVLLEILRIVREMEAPRPSTYLSTSDTSPGVAAVRGTEPARLTKELRGELDWIAMKALEKDRARRYETANGFAADVQRYLAGEPVLAHPPSAGYRLRKFVRKNRGPVVAASLILLALIGGAVGTVYGVIKADGERTANGLRDQAERDRDAAESARKEADVAREGEKKARAAEEIARMQAENAQIMAERQRDSVVGFVIEERMATLKQDTSKKIEEKDTSKKVEEKGFRPPLARMSYQKTNLLIVCENGKLFLFDMNTLIEPYKKAVGRFALDTQAATKFLRERMPVEMGASPIAGGDYNIKMLTLTPSNSSGNSIGVIPAFELVRKATSPGQALDQVKAGQSALTERLNALKPDDNIIQFYVYPDSFEMFREVRKILVEKKFELGWLPLETGKPVMIGSVKTPITMIGAER